GDDAMRELGWDYFAGYLDGAPYPIDTTAGGVAPPGTYHCGFVPNTTADINNGADYGVCYLPAGHSDGSHLLMTDPDQDPTARPDSPPSPSCRGRRRHSTSAAMPASATCPRATATAATS